LIISASTPYNVYNEHAKFGNYKLADTFLKHFSTIVGPKFLLSDILECKLI